MGLWEELKKLTKPYEDEDSFVDGDAVLYEQPVYGSRRSERRAAQSSYAGPVYTDTPQPRRAASAQETRHAAAEPRYSATAQSGFSTAAEPRYSAAEPRFSTAEPRYSTAEPRRSTETGKRSSSFGEGRRESKVVNINATAQLKVVLLKPERFEYSAEAADHLRDKHTVVVNLESTKPEVARRIVDFLSGVAYAQDGKINRIAANTYIIVPYNVDVMGDVLDELESNGLYF